MLVSHLVLGKGVRRDWEGEGVKGEEGEEGKEGEWE